MTKRSAVLRDHVAAGILDIAATVLAERGEATTMSDIAEAAGVSRATLYRYFPSRDALLQALYTVALTDLSDRIADARVDTVPVTEAIARVTRAVIAATNRYQALRLFQKNVTEEEQGDEHLAGPLRALFHRGAAEGAFRTDLPIEALIEVYLGMLQGAVSRVIQGDLGVEQASAAITSIFMTGVLDDSHRA